MALGTKEGSQAPATMGAAPMVHAPAPHKPVLFDDLDPVLLVRLYPHGKTLADMRHEAKEAGEAAQKAGEHLVASQQEPVTGAPAPAAPAHA